MSRDDRPPYQPDGIQQQPLLQQPLPAATALLSTRQNSVPLQMPVPIVAEQDLRSSDPTSYATTAVYPLDYPLVPQMSAALAAAAARPPVSATGSSLVATAANLPFQHQHQQNQQQSQHHPQQQSSQQSQQHQQSTTQHQSSQHPQQQPSTSTNTHPQQNVLQQQTLPHSQQQTQQQQQQAIAFPAALRTHDRTEFSNQPASPSLIPPRSISTVQAQPLQNPQSYLPIEQALSNSQTFSSLTSGIVSHPLFALLIKKVFEACGSNGFDTNGDIANHFADSESSARNLQNYAETQGLDRTFERWTTIDVFMSALISVFSSLPATMQTNNALNLNQPLQFSVVTGQKIIATGEQAYDPRNIGARMNNFGVRNDRLIYKPNHGSTTRTPLSERAKAALEKWFQENLENPYPTVAQKMELAKVCDMSLSSVNNWFGNKRMRIKRKMLNVNSSTDPNGYTGDTPSISDKVLAPRSKWNAVVVSKMNSQEGREVVANATGRANLCTDDHDVVTSNVIRAGDPSNTIGLHDQRFQPPGTGRGLEHLP